MLRVPIYEKLKNDSGTVFHFSNSNNDLTKTLTDNSIRRSPSKFVCLRLPDWKTPVTNRRGMYVNPSEFGTSPLVLDPDQLVPKMFQNYLENLMFKATQIPNVPKSFMDNLPEVAFWKMLKRMNTVDLRVDGANYKDLYDETTNDKGLVQYIGDINLMNHIKDNGHEYSELYLHIPHDAKKVTNLKWKRDTTPIAFSKVPLNGNGGTLAEGLNSSSGINKAMYDHDGTNELLYYDFADGLDRLMLNFDEYDTINESFEFNCVIMYYDEYNVVNPNAVTRKLGSVLFTDDFDEIPSTGGHTIPLTKKNIDDDGITGNSIAYRINSRFFYGNNNITADTILNQYNTISMDLYMDALKELVEITKMFTEQTDSIEELQNKIYNIESIIGTNKSYNDLQVTIDGITQQIADIQGGESNISMDELFNVFDTLVQQINSMPTNGTINNTFSFGGGGSADLYDGHFGTNSDDKVVVNYARTSALERMNYQNYIVSPVSFSTSKVNNKLRLNIDNDGSGIKVIKYNHADGTNSSTQYGASSFELDVNFANDTDTPLHYVWYIDTGAGSTNAIPISLAFERDFKNMVAIATFILPTENDFDTRGLRSLQVIGGGASSLSLSEKHFKNVGGKTTVGFSDDTYLSILTKPKRRFLHPITVSTSVNGNNLKVDIGIDASNLNNVTNFMVYDTFNGTRQLPLGINGLNPFATNSGEIIEMVAFLRSASTSNTIVFIPLSEIINEGLDSNIIDTTFIPLFIFTNTELNTYGLTEKINLVPLTKLRYTNSELLPSGGSGGGLSPAQVNTLIEQKIDTNVTNDNTTSVASSTFKQLYDAYNSNPIPSNTDINSIITNRISDTPANDSTKALTLKGAQDILDAISNGSGLTESQVNALINGRLVDNLASSNSNKILTANQGRLIDLRVNGTKTYSTKNTSLLRDTENFINSINMKKVNDNTIAILSLGSTETSNDSNVSFYDISDKYRPILITAFYHNSLKGATDFIIKGNVMVLLSKYNHTIITVDISDINTPTYMNHIGIPLVGGNSQTESIGIHQTGKYVYTATLDGRVVSINITNPNLLTISNILTNLSGNKLTCLEMHGNVIYVGSHDSSNGSIHSMNGAFDGSIIYQNTFNSSELMPSFLLHDGDYIYILGRDNKTFSTMKTVNNNPHDLELIATHTIDEVNPSHLHFDFESGALYLTHSIAGESTKIYIIATENIDQYTKYGEIANENFLKPEAVLVNNSVVYTISQETSMLTAHALKNLYSRNVFTEA